MQQLPENHEKLANVEVLAADTCSTLKVVLQYILQLQGYYILVIHVCYIHV